MLRYSSVVLALALCFPAVTRASDAQPPGTPSAATAEQLIAQLDDPDPKVRTAATAEQLIAQLDDPDPKVRTAANLQLNNLPGTAADAVEAALKSGTASPEAQIRLQTAVKILRPRARNEGLDLDGTKWVNTLWHAGYHKAGQPAAPYDKEVDDAIDAFLKLPADSSPMSLDLAHRRVAEQFKAAIDQGCDDEFVRMLSVITRGGNAPMRERLDCEGKFIEWMKGPADPCLKLALVNRYAPHLLHASSQLARLLPATVEQAIVQPNVSETGLYTLIADLDVTCYKRRLAFEKFAASIDAYAKSRPSRVEPLVVRGLHQSFDAYEARDKLKQEDPARDKVYQDGLASAEKTLQQAWQLDPNDARAATLMISIKQAQGPSGGGRDAMEVWFKRATDACPDSTDACIEKLKYLMPNAFGSREEMIAFGRECLQTSNWRAGVPFILVTAHQTIAAWSGNPARYYANPEAWKDIQDVYEGCLLNFPNDTLHRNQYLFIAIQARQYDVAQRQVEILGDKADWWFNRKGSFGDARYIREQKLHPTTRPTTK